MISIAGVDKRWIGAALACVAAVSLGGCAVNPATGDVDLILLSAEDERRLGAQEHPKISRQFGGAYDLKRLTDYVTGVGRKLGAHAEYPADRFRFTVLDTPIVNAFALPGGYIYVTRGLVALAGNEAELAGVLAHEIGHVTARHSAQRYSQQMLTGLGAGVLGAVTRSRAARDLANLGGTLYLREAKHTVATVTDGEQPQVTHLSLDPCPSGSGHRRQAIDGNAFALAQLQTRRPTAHDIPHQIEPIAAGLIKNHRWPLAMRGDHAVR